ncbi:DNA replication/repair protein RecF, partial [Vibrio cholerae]|nr:DNA replication/repair protein RecF [Vibrio cholerae]
RNHLLKKMQGNSKNEETMLDVFTLQLIEHGAKILQKRFEFLHLLQEWAAPIHRGISRGLEELEIVYKPSVDVSESMDLSKIKEVYYESFQSVKQREIFRGTTLLG